ncbi:MAG: sulfonate ABC transporter permease, partial [Deltaproteobacteria bacterium]|nr:sulfonate ABC transporter permease [Deltaproteobacteria bacterium]
MAVRAFLLKPIGLGLRISLLDIILLLGIFAVLYSFISVGMEMAGPMTGHSFEISTSLESLPYYMLRSLVRMFIAFAASLVFTFVFSSIAASGKRAEKVMLPLLDILQSIPVLGFLSVTIK